MADDLVCRFADNQGCYIVWAIRTARFLRSSSLANSKLSLAASKFRSFSGPFDSKAFEAVRNCRCSFDFRSNLFASHCAVHSDELARARVTQRPLGAGWDPKRVWWIFIDSFAKAEFCLKNLSKKSFANSNCEWSANDSRTIRGGYCVSSEWFINSESMSVTQCNSKNCECDCSGVTTERSLVAKEFSKTMQKRTFGASIAAIMKSTNTLLQI